MVPAARAPASPLAASATPDENLAPAAPVSSPLPVLTAPATAPRSAPPARGPVAVADSEEPPAPDRVRNGAMLLPFIGLHSFQDSNTEDLDAGLRVGLLVGGFVNNNWSLNVGATFDLLNPNDKAPGGTAVDISGQVLGLTFSPLLHAGNAKAEFVVGPKVGGWIQWLQASGTDQITGTAASASGLAEGWTIGANMGVFIAASPSVLVGALLSLEVRDFIHECASGTGVAETCDSKGDSSTILGFAFGVML